MVNISPATPVADYTIRLDLNATFNYAACQPDGDDIRFFDNSNTPLSFWVEKWTSGGDSIIWVKIPVAGTTSIKMAYGNATIGAGSNGDATFPFFDDFSGASIDSAKWTVEVDAYSTATIVGGTVHLQSLTPSPWGSFTGLGFTDFIIKHGQSNGMDSNNSVYRCCDNLETRRTDLYTTTTIKKNITWILMDYKWISGSSAIFCENESVVASHATNVPTIALPVTYATRCISGTASYGALIRSKTTFAPGYAVRSKVYFQHDYRAIVPCMEPVVDVDWVFVRKCTSVESIATFSSLFISIDSPSDGEVFSTTSVPVSITVKASTDIIWYVLDSGTATPMPTNTTITVADGAHSIIFYANDTTSGVISSASRLFTVDTAAPVVEITSPTDGECLSSTSVNIVFTAIDLTKDATWYTIDGGAPVVVAGSSFSMFLSDGAHAIAVYCNDSLGRISSDSVSVIIDATAPSIAVSGFAGLYIQQGDVAYLNWTLHDAHPATFTLRLNGQVIRSGFYSSGASLSVLIDASVLGSRNYTMTVEDTFGNVRSLERDITVVPRTDSGIFLSVGVNIIDQSGTQGLILTLTMSHWAVLYLDVAISVTTTSSVLPGPLPSGLVIALPVAFNLNITNSSALSSGSIRIFYDQAAIANQVNENDMVPLRWNEATSSWVPTTSGLSRSQNYVDIPLSQNGIYVIASTPKQNYVPILVIVLIGITGGIVAVASYSYSRKKKIQQKASNKVKSSQSASYTPINQTATEILDQSLAKRARLMQTTAPSMSARPSAIGLFETAENQVMPGEAVKKKAGSSAEPDVDIATRVANAQQMASEVSIEVVTARCVVHKGQISGLSYTCKNCGTVYCMKCARHLVENSESCWICKEPISLAEGEHKDSDDNDLPKITVGLFSPDVWHKIRQLDIPEEIFDEVIEYLKGVPPSNRIKYLEETFKEDETFDSEF
ncbi:MAG: DUF2341 domain-containing protein [Candidatus Sigynarchaeota archaeon]